MHEYFPSTITTVFLKASGTAGAKPLTTTIIVKTLANTTNNTTSGGRFTTTATALAA